MYWLSIILSTFAAMKKLISILLVFFPAFLMAQGQTDHNFEVAKNLDIFNNVYKNLDLLYVDTLNPKDVIGTGINAMLRRLDP